jgi:hypothetical protein
MNSLVTPFKGGFNQGSVSAFMRKDATFFNNPKNPPKNPTNNPRKPDSKK